MKTPLYADLKRKIVLITLLVAIGPLIFLGGVIFYQFAGLCEERARTQIQQLASSQSHAIDVFLKERVNILTTLADTVSLDTLTNPAALASILNRINRRADGLALVDLGVIDDRGNHLAYAGPYRLESLNYYAQPWFGEVMARGKYISDVYLGYRQFPHFIIAVRGQSGRDVWILRATIDSEIFNRLVHSVQIGETGDAYIVNTLGLYQTRPRFIGEILSVSGLQPDNFRGGARTFIRADREGKKIFYAGGWLKDGTWLFVVTRKGCDEEGRLLELVGFFESLATLISRVFIFTCWDSIVSLRSHRVLTTTFGPA